MAITQNLYEGDNSTTNYAFTFPYLKQTDIKVQLDADVTTAWSLANATTVAFDSAPGTGVKIKIYRETDTDTSPATFYAGSSIKSEDLNDNFTQNLYSNQEVNARYLSNLGGTMTGSLTMGEDAKLIFEGATDDAHETTLYVADPTADRTITLPNVTGTVVTTGDTGSVATGMIAADAITNAKIADNALDSEHYTDGSIDADHLASSSVTTAKIAADAITGAKIADNAIDSEHYTDGSIDTAHIADSQITSAKIADGTIVAADLASDSVTTAKITNANVTTVKIAADAITAAKIADDVVNSEHYAAGSIDTEHYAENSVDSTALAADAVTSAQLADNAVDSEHYVDGSIDLAHLSANSVDSSKIVDDTIVNADINSSAAIAHSKLAAVADTQILVGNGSNVPSAVAVSGDITIANTGAVTIANDAVEIGMIGCEQTTISDSDSHIPTSGAVVDYVNTQLSAVGGFETIATDAAFPNTQVGTGIIVSIADAGGLVVNGSGTSTTGRTVGGSTVTINNINSQFNSTTVAAGVAFMVESTGSGQIYNYHKATLKEADLINLSTDIDDFGNRYRVNAGEPSSNNDDGDLVWDTTANKMKVYNSTASAWEEVTSVGDYKLLTIKDHDQAVGGSGPTFNDSNEEYDLFDGSSDASITSAGQLLVVLNGVLQKPNSGTFSGSEEGFYLNDTHGIKFCDPPAAGSTLFVTQIGSATTLQTPSDGSVTAAKIGAGAVTAAKIGTGAVELAKMASESVDEDNLYISNAGSNGQFLSKQSGNNGGLTWATAGAGGATGLDLNDDVKIRLGTDNDAEIYYNNANDRVEFVFSSGKWESISGDWKISGALNLTGSDITWGTTSPAELMMGYQHAANGSRISNTHSGGLKIWSDLGKITKQSNTSFEYLVWNDGAGVDLYHSDTKEFGTKAGGVKLFGHSESIVTALTSASTVTIDFGLSNHFSCTMGHNITFANPTTESVGQSGTIVLTQDGTGSRTASWGSQFLWAGGTAPTLSTGANAVDRIDYFVAAADKIHCVASLAMA